MALVINRHSAPFRLGAVTRGPAALVACLMLGACAQGPSLEASSPATPAAQAAASDEPEMRTREELVKATDWWGRKYSENPRDLEAALSYARNLKAMGEKQRALAVLQQASLYHGRDKDLASEYGRLALELDQISVANRLLAAADDPINPDWRVVSARGTVLAKQGKFGDAIPFFERALALSHNQPSVLSNLALAHAMNGEAAKAEDMLRQAAAADGSSLKIRQNLALVLGLQGKYEEARVIAQHDMSADKAKENADYLRRVVKLDPKPMPAKPAPAAPVEPVEHKPMTNEAPQKPAAAVEVPVARATQPEPSPFITVVEVARAVPPPAGAIPGRLLAPQEITMPVRKPAMLPSSAFAVARAQPLRSSVVLPQRKPSTAIAVASAKMDAPKPAVEGPYAVADAVSSLSWKSAQHSSPKLMKAAAAARKTAKEISKRVAQASPQKSRPLKSETRTAEVAPAETVKREELAPVKTAAAEPPRQWPAEVVREVDDAHVWRTQVALASAATKPKGKH
jgi:Flp pilus assembly protein TadD